ncbi:MAG TPA: hypothetical protein VIQ80_01545 [Candidatus Saccharimonadales bacterium]
MTEVEPSPIKRRVEEHIARIVHDGKGEWISYIGVAPREGLLLALAGVITLRHLEGAEETQLYITMKNVPLGGKRYTVRVMKDAMYPVAAYDPHGEPIL